MKRSTKLILGVGGAIVAIGIVGAVGGESGHKDTSAAASTSVVSSTPETATVVAPVPAKSVDTAAPIDTDTTVANSPVTVEPAADPAPVVSSGQKNALSAGKDYLDMSAFSYTGLIKQLEYEGYSESDATYAADNVGADWTEQAVRSGKEYLKMTAFSHSGLVEQLEYEGFTPEQAEAGATGAGV